MISKIDKIKTRAKGEKVIPIKEEMQKSMTNYCSVFRNERDLSNTLSVIQSLKDRYQKIIIDNTGLRFNTDLMEALELESLLGLAEIVVISALNRLESRGAHLREDFPDRDDQNWLKHTLVKRGESGLQIFYKPVTITKFEPKPRVY